MGHWGVKSYEMDEAHDALDAGFERVHGAAYDDLMDDRNPMAFEQVQQQLAGPETLAAALDVLREEFGDDRDAWDELARLGLRRGRRPPRRAEGADPRRRPPIALWPGWRPRRSTGMRPPRASSAATRRSRHLRKLGG